MTEGEHDVFFAERRALRRQAKRNEMVHLLAASVANHFESLRAAQSIGMLGDSLDNLDETIGALTDVVSSREPGDAAYQRVEAYLEKTKSMPRAERVRRVVLDSTVTCNIGDLTDAELDMFERILLDRLRPVGATSVVSVPNGEGSFSPCVAFVC